VRLGLYRAVVRFLGTRALLTVVTGVSVSVGLLLIVNHLMLGKGVHISTFAIYWALALIYVGGSRMVARALIHARRLGSDRVAIYGAGVAGAQVASALLGSGRYYPVAFIDDSKGLQGSSINGIEVCAPEDLPALIADDGVNTVLLALPSLSRRRRQEILHALEPLAVHVQTVPDIQDIVGGRATVGRHPRGRYERSAWPRSRPSAGGAVRHLCARQGDHGHWRGRLDRVGALPADRPPEPSRLVLFEMSELALYNIDRELRSLVAHEQLTVDIVALLGNAHHRSRVREVLHAYGVQTIYHAASYKHVPIVEQNIVEGVHNNVFSTWYTAEAAVECGVETFVLISTDKAVNPTNVMGATKRLAEIVLQGLHQRGTNTRFCMVRFGNVLESSGSVVPLFREQIRRGGPVTVTHPEVIRYFMTIPKRRSSCCRPVPWQKAGMCSCSTWASPYASRISPGA
jgi:FlaA1/EpsC-like NDP-sugar epimerase